MHTCTCIFYVHINFILSPPPFYIPSLFPPLPLSLSFLQGWLKEQLLEAWMANPREACEKAGVELPSDLGMHNMDAPAVPGHRGGGRKTEERECGVCFVSFSPDIEVPCGHIFCRDCWQHYLHQKIELGDAHSITCPAYACYRLVPLVSNRFHSLTYITCGSA